MNTKLLSLFEKLQNLVSHEEGQDLVEYALVVAIIALGATASMQGLAQVISVLVWQHQHDICRRHITSGRGIAGAARLNAFAWSMSTPEL